MYQRIMSEN